MRSRWIYCCCLMIESCKTHPQWILDHNARLFNKNLCITSVHGHSPPVVVVVTTGINVC